METAQKQEWKAISILHGYEHPSTDTTRIPTFFPAKRHQDTEITEAIKREPKNMLSLSYTALIMPQVRYTEEQGQNKAIYLTQATPKRRLKSFSTSRSCSS